MPNSNASNLQPWNRVLHSRKIKITCALIAGILVHIGYLAAQPPKNEARLFRRTIVKDSGMGDMPAYSLLAPKSFQVKADVRWDPTSRFSYANFVGEVLNPANGVELHFLPSLFFEYLNMAGIPKQRHGARIEANGNTWMPLQTSSEELAVKVLVPMLRPNSKDVVFHKMQDYPEVAKVYQKMLQPAIDNQKKLDDDIRRKGMQPAQEIKTNFYSQRIRVTYKQNDSRFHEDIYFTMMVMSWHSPASFNLPEHTLWKWNLSEIKSVRAPAKSAEQLEVATPEMLSVAMSVRRLPEYDAVMAKLASDLLQQEFRNALRRAEANRRDAAELARIHQAIYKDQMESRDRMHERFIDSIRGVERWFGGNGTQLILPEGYTVAWENKAGDVYLTNDRLFNPGVSVDPAQDWKQLERQR